LSKDHPGILLIKEEVDKQYSEGRVAAFSDLEIDRLIQKHLPTYWKNSQLSR